nr:probable linoleate 9S-lipoxygenase 5 [Quercus suber]POE76811.1 putative linoleate 9s-lipoxygenase 5 [Quercus suber]
MLQNIINKITGDDESRNKKVEGTVVLMKKNVLDFNDFNASVLDGFLELLGQKVSFQLISAVNGDPAAALCLSFNLLSRYSSPVPVRTRPNLSL